MQQETLWTLLHPPPSPEGLGALHELIEEQLRAAIAELREQYVIGYYPSEDLGDGAWHDVKVRVQRPGVTVRTREGYFDY